jgi:hypothetical protein
MLTALLLATSTIAAPLPEKARIPKEPKVYALFHLRNMNGFADAEDQRKDALKRLEKTMRQTNGYNFKKHIRYQWLGNTGILQVWLEDDSEQQQRKWLRLLAGMVVKNESKIIADLMDGRIRGKSQEGMLVVQEKISLFPRLEYLHNLPNY